MCTVHCRSRCVLGWYKPDDRAIVLGHLDHPKINVAGSNRSRKVIRDKIKERCLVESESKIEC